ncbi:MAG: H-NS histone family protein [Methylococcaceae bacterium]|nr:H-NS histone family protein [Methylococcaceae bacterium]
MSGLDSLSVTELQQMKKNVEIALKEKQDRERKEVYAQIRALAASVGATVEIFDTKEKTVRKNGKVAPKYRNPDDADITWTGRGVMPKWMRALLEAGRDKSDFLI